MKHFLSKNLLAIASFLFCILHTHSMNANKGLQNKFDLMIFQQLNESSLQEYNRPNPLQFIFRKNKNQNKKITAAIFAFPFPFGIVGLHRIYLGCAPHIPVVYIASLGGAFGVLPLIDFIVLLKEEDISKFNNSNKVFMWVE